MQKHRVVVEMSSSSITPCQVSCGASSGLIHPSTPSVHETVTLRGCQKSPWVTDYQRLCPCLRSHSIPPVKVQYPPVLWIYQSHDGNLRSWGHNLVFWFSGLRWRRLNTNQGSDLPWSFIKRCPLSGSRVAWSWSHPSGIRAEL